MIKQLRLVIAVMAAGILIYCGLWFTAAFEAEKNTAALFAKWRDQGLQINHGKIEHGGFPYRITVDVAGLKINTRANGLIFKAKTVRLVSHLWTPGHWIAEADTTDISLAGGSISFTDPFIHGSYRIQEDGAAIVVVEPQSTDDMILHSFFGHPATKPDNWQLALRFGKPAETGESSLYGKRFLDFKVDIKGASKSFVATGGLSGPVIRDWSKTAMATWRDEGGLLDLDAIDYAVPGGRTKGSASLTLDELFRPIGSANLMQSGDSKLFDLFDMLGINSKQYVLKSGPVSIMSQLGTLRINNQPVAELQSLIE